MALVAVVVAVIPTIVVVVMLLLFLVGRIGGRGLIRTPGLLDARPLGLLGTTLNGLLEAGPLGSSMEKWPGVLVLHCYGASMVRRRQMGKTLRISHPISSVILRMPTVKLAIVPHTVFHDDDFRNDKITGLRSDLDRAIICRTGIIRGRNDTARGEADDGQYGETLKSCFHADISNQPFWNAWQCYSPLDF